MLIQHKGTQSIETVRLLLRRFCKEDAEDMFDNWAKDPEVCKYLLWGPHKDVEASRSRIIQWVNQYEVGNSYVWAITLQVRNIAIGSISVEISNDSSMSCEVGYCIGKAYWSRGIMTEALLAVLHYLFNDVGYQQIQAKHDTQNVASGRVMQKAGMHFAKYEYHVGLRRDGTFYDCAVYEKHISEE
jgi:[ribosomal protein S5]-alanine N-acetyltransferase